jgi:carbon-monoxide dehydrogenase large subunit
MSDHVIGRPVPRTDAHAKVTGAATYVADIALPRMLHAAVVCAGVPHARIRGIDTAVADEMPGVRRIVTGRGCTMLFGTVLRDQPPIAVDKVRHAGEAVAVVLADTALQATAAAKKVAMDLEELPFVLNPRTAAGADAPIVHERNGEYEHPPYSVHPVSGSNVFHHYKLRRGDATSAMAGAAVTVESEFRFPLSSHAAIEPHACIARFSPDGSLEVWAANQAPFVVRDVLATMFDLPTTRVRVRVPYVGGGFGGKSDVAIEPLVAYAASFVPGYAVKLVLSRKEVFTSSLLGRGMEGRMKLGATPDGDLVALEAEMYFADGAYGDTGWPVCTVAGHNCAGPYRVPAAGVDVYGVYTNSPPVGAYRGYGHPEGQFMMGRLMDMLARKLNVPTADLMRRNFLREGDENLLGQRIRADHGDLPACLDAVTGALDEFDAARGTADPGTADPRTAARPTGDPAPGSGRYLYGRGIAGLAKSPKMAPSASSGCHLTVGADGTVCLNLAGIEMGQGSQTVFTQMAAEALGLPVDRVRAYDEVDTQNAPWDWQTVASMQTYRGGRAIQDACEKAIVTAKTTAAVVFGCDPAEVEYEAGVCRPPGRPGGDEPGELTLAELSRGYTYENGRTVGVPIETVGSYRVAEIVEPDPETGTGNAAGSWTFGVEAAQVRVDRETGEVQVEHFAVALDPGRVINPQTARGQVTGGVVQGLGATLLEETVFKDDGTIRNTNFGPYKVPRLSHVPKQFSVTFIETPNEVGPWGAKPLGEHPIVAVAPAVLNAIRDATGVEFTELPVTADVLKARLDGAGASSPPERPAGAGEEGRDD